MEPTTTTNHLEHLAWDGPIGLPIAMLAALGLLLVFAWALHRERGVIGRRNAALFWLLRAGALGIALWMLLAPTTLRVQRSESRQAVAVVTDVSGSMHTVDPAGTAEDFRWLMSADAAGREAAADRALAAAGIADRQLSVATQVLREYRAESRVRDAAMASQIALDRVRENLKAVIETRDRWLTSSAAVNANDPLDLATRILATLDAPEFQAFSDLAKALERGRAPSQRGWRESLPDLGYRLVSLGRRLAELALRVGNAEQEAHSTSRQPADPETSRLARVGTFVNSLEKTVLGPLRDSVDIRYCIFDETLTSVPQAGSVREQIVRHA